MEHAQYKYQNIIIIIIIIINIIVQQTFRDRCASYMILRLIPRFVTSGDLKIKFSQSTH